MEMAVDQTMGGEHTMQYTYDILQSCAPETYIILLTSVTPTNSIKNKQTDKCGRKKENVWEGGKKKVLSIKQT